MRLQVKGRNVEVSDSIRRYAEDKLGKLERQLADPTQVELELAIEHNPSIAANHVAEATIWTKGPTLRAREAATSYEASIDQLVDKLERQGKRYRAKRSRRETGRGGGGGGGEGERGGGGADLLGRAAGANDRQVEAVRPPAADAGRGRAR